MTRSTENLLRKPFDGQITTPDGSTLRTALSLFLVPMAYTAWPRGFGQLSLLFLKETQSVLKLDAQSSVSEALSSLGMNSGQGPI